MLKKLLSMASILAMLLTAAPALADGDTEAPVVTGVSPLSATEDAPLTITGTFTDNLAVTGCNLIVNGGLVGPMQIAGSTAGSATVVHAFGSDSDYYYVTVECSDAAGNLGQKTVQVMMTNVNEPPGTPPSGYQDRLVKLRCPAGAVDVNHPCKAVYFVGRDGKRHAFSNEKVFFTWYTNFGGVVEITGTQLAAIPLGTNVTYHPGIRMVKFPSVDRVYVVARGGVLRWVKTETAATTLYGAGWNRTKVDDVSEAFYANYRFGADVNSAIDFNVTGETSAVINISDNF